jgi:cell division protein FtsB
MLKGLTDVFLKIAEQHGPFVALTVIMLIFFGALTYWLIRQVIKSKNAEIDRLVKERNKLQEIILRKRLTTKNE